MPVSKETDAALDLTIFTATGTVPFSEQMEALKVFYENTPTRNVIWDFTRVDEVRISGAELQEIVRYTKMHAKRRRGGRTALVANTELKYGFSRMASAYAELEETPWSMEVFEDLNKALAWISGNDHTP